MLNTWLSLMVCRILVKLREEGQKAQRAPGKSAAGTFKNVYNSSIAQIDGRFQYERRDRSIRDPFEMDPNWRCPASSATLSTFGEVDSLNELTKTLVGPRAAKSLGLVLRLFDGVCGHYAFPSDRGLYL